MKIIVVHTDPFPSPMAGSVFSLSSAVGFAQAGHDTVLMMPDTGKSIEEGVKYYGIHIPEKLSIELPSRQDLGIGNFRFTYSERYYRAVAKRLGQIPDADAIIVRTLKLAAFLAKKDLPAPLIYEMHDWYGDVDMKWEGASWMILAKKLRHEKALSKLEKTTLPKLSALLTLRNATAKVVKEYYPDLPLEVAPTGVFAPEDLPKVSSDPVVVYLGQLHPHKGIDLLFDIAAIAKDLRFLIIGGGDWLDHWKKEGAAKGVSDRFEFTGHISKAEVPENLAKGRVGILPLLDCFFNRYLTSPLKIMEYYSAGLPVVTADGPVTAEVVLQEKTGLLAPYGDVEAFAKALSRLCADDESHAACRQNIKDALDQLTWAKRAEKIAGFIESL